MNFSDLTKALSDATMAIQSAEKLPIPILAVRASKAYEAYPTDITLFSIANVLNKMADGGKTFITRAEFNSIYNKFYTTNTKFAQIFSEEIGPRDLATPTYMNRDAEDENFIENSFNTISDPVLANALEDVFDRNGIEKGYSKEIGVKANQACSYGLECIGMQPKSVSVFAGKDDILICQATYETPKGQSNVLVPIELSGTNALLPTMFLTTAGFVDLSANELKSHVVKTAGISYKVDGAKILDVLLTAKHGATEELTCVDRALMNRAASTETPSTYASDGILYQQLNSKGEVDVEIPEYEQPEEIVSFAKRLSTPKGIACQLFGDYVVAAGLNLLSRELKKLGYKNVQVSVADSDENTLYCAASVGTAGFKIPLTVKDSMVSFPTIALAAGRLYDFSKEGLKELVNSSSKDVRMMATASKMSELSPSEVLKQIKLAMEVKDYDRAEDCLNVLASMDDSVSYHAGLATYMNALNMKNKLAAKAEELEEKVMTPYLNDHKVYL